MVRVVIAVVLSAVVQMAWGTLFWAVLPFSQTIVQELPDEGRVMAALRETVKESGHYFAPNPNRAKGSEGEKALLEAQRRGPHAWRRRFEGRTWARIPGDGGATPVLVAPPDARTIPQSRIGSPTELSRTRHATPDDGFGKRQATVVPSASVLSARIRPL